MANVPKGFGGVEDLIRRFQDAEKLWNLWRSLHQEAFDFAAPNRETFTIHSPGQRKSRQIFDSTAVISLQQFSNRIQGALLPPWQQWMDLVSGDDIPEEEEDKTDQALESLTDTFFSHLNHSNFYTELSPMLIDLGIGTGAIMVEEGDFATGETLRFTNVPLAELYPEKPPGGPIESGWRKQLVKPMHIKRSWPGADLPTDLAKLAKKPESAEVTILNGMLFNPVDKKYHQVVIYEPNKSLLFTQSFNTKRLIISRWHLTPGEVFGRGPVIQQLPDIRTVNKVKQFILENAAIQMAGIYTGVDDGIFNPHTVRIAPGAVIAVASNSNQNPTLQPLNRSGDLGMGQLIMQDLQDNIRKALFADPLGDLTDPVRSATEIMLRNQDMLRNSGASFGRQKTELIEPIVNAVVDILGSLGEIPKVAVDGKQITIRQASPLAKAEALEDFQNSQVWFQSLAQLPPEVVAAKVKIEDIPGFWADKLGVPATLIRTEEETQELASQVQEAAGQAIEQGAPSGA
jgi:hypothetical protein